MTAAACPDMPERAVRGACARCGADLPKGRRKWCSVECMDSFAANHWFSTARYYAMRRAEVFDLTASHRWRVGYACEGCGEVSMRVEVDHIERAHGAHGQSSCIHHQANLRVLCVPCHRAVTAAQRAEEAAARREAKRAADPQRALL